MSEKGIARVGDRVEGICKDHSGDRNFVGYWQHGSGTVYSDNLSVIRVGDTGVADCGHTFVAIEGSSIGDESGKKIHRVTDQVKIGSNGGTGTTVTGSANVFAS